MEKEKRLKLGKNSQEAKLRKEVKLALIAVGTGILTLVLFSVANFSLSSAQKEELETTMALNQYRLGSKALTYAVQSYAVSGDRAYYDDYMKELNEDKNRDKALATLKENNISDEEWAGLNHIAELSEGLVPLEEEAMSYAEAGDTLLAQSFVFSDEYEKTIVEINQQTDKVIAQVTARNAGIITFLTVASLVLQFLFIASFAYLILRMIKTIQFARMDLLVPVKKVSAQMGLLAQGDFGVALDLKEDDSEVGNMVSSINFMKKNIQGMIEEISVVLGQMGNGNYKAEITQEYVGEFKSIKDSFLTIMQKMRETLTTIRSVSGQIDSGSEQLACAAEDLAEGCTDQAGQVSGLVSLVEDMLKTMEESSQEAETSVELASQAGATLQVENQKMQELKDAIGEINKCSEQILSIIGTIEDIASQTNLLSLNAAIEAARAGEAGKGFAVVAEQVKNLAEESARAAGQTTLLIDTTVEAVNKGIAIADESVMHMDQVMDGAAAATDKMKQISEILSESVEHMHVFSKSITQVSSVVDSNSAASEETAAVSEEQKAQAETLVSLIDKFQI